MSDKTEKPSTEYPKSMHAGGDRNAAHRIVHSDEDESAARAEGFKMIDKDAEKTSVARIAALNGAAQVDAQVEAKPAAKKAK